jgi:hypothetical protein
MVVIPPENRQSSVGEFLRVLEASVQGPRKLEGGPPLVVGLGLCGKRDVAVLARLHDSKYIPVKLRSLSVHRADGFHADRTCAERIEMLETHLFSL